MQVIRLGYGAIRISPNQRYECLLAFPAYRSWHITKLTPMGRAKRHPTRAMNVGCRFALPDLRDSVFLLTCVIEYDQNAEN